MKNDTYIKNLLETDFASKKLMNLYQMQNIQSEVLKRDPQNLKAQLEIKKIENDIQCLTAVLNKAGIPVLKEMEKRYNLKFEFLTNESKAPTQSKVLKVEK